MKSLPKAGNPRRRLERSSFELIEDRAWLSIRGFCYILCQKGQRLGQKHRIPYKEMKCGAPVESVDLLQD